jgi:hypothetical protein
VAFGERVVKWEGDCQQGKADGLGALRAYEGSRAVQIFFGRLEHGQPKLGVIDKFGSFSSGRFSNGKVIDSEPVDENGVSLMVVCFEEAIAAAKQVSAHFESAGNAASAKYYAERARVLERQLE